MEKTIMAIIITVIIIPISFAAGMSFSDINGNEWFATQVQRMTEAGILKGNPDNTYRPSDNVNRAEIAVISDRIVNYMRAREFGHIISKEAEKLGANIYIDDTLIVKYPGNKDQDPWGDLYPVTQEGMEMLISKVEEYSDYSKMPREASILDCSDAIEEHGLLNNHDAERWNEDGEFSDENFELVFDITFPCDHIFGENITLKMPDFFEIVD